MQCLTYSLHCIPYRDANLVQAMSSENPGFAIVSRWLHGCCNLLTTLQPRGNLVTTFCHGASKLGRLLLPSHGLVTSLAFLYGMARFLAKCPGVEWVYHCKKKMVNLTHGGLTWLHMPKKPYTHMSLTGQVDTSNFSPLTSQQLTSEAQYMHVKVVIYIRKKQIVNLT